MHRNSSAPLVLITIACLSAMGCRERAGDAKVPSLGSHWFEAVRSLEDGDDPTSFAELRIERTMPAGIALVDLEGDGSLELVYLTHALRPTRRLCASTLAPDSAPLAGHCENLGVDTLPMGLIVGDYDGDQSLDVWVAALGTNSIWWSPTSAGRLEFASPKVQGPLWTVGGSQLPNRSLYLVSYIERQEEPSECRGASGQRDFCGPTNFPALGDRRWSAPDEWRTANGVPAPGLGSALVPLEEGVALYVANDTADNRLMIWRDTDLGSDEAESLGVARNSAGQREGSMGVAVGDVDANGLFDLFVTHINSETNTLYLQQPDGTFLDQTRLWGLGSPSLGLTGFGTAFLDIDTDGWLDLVVANGAVQLAGPGPGQVGLAQPNQVFRNRQGEGFELVSAETSGLSEVEISRGLAIGDIDNDGDTDFAISNLDGPIRVYENRAKPKLAWLGIDLRWDDGSIPILATVQLDATESGHRATQLRRFARDGSYGSSSDPRVLFAVNQSPVCVSVTWYLEGAQAGALAREEFCGLEDRRYHSLVRGQGVPAAAPDALHTPD